MSRSLNLGEPFDTFIDGQLASGRYHDAAEVVTDALRLMAERDRRLSELDAAVARGIADLEAGRWSDGEAVFDEAETRYRAMTAEPSGS